MKISLYITVSIMLVVYHFNSQAMISGPLVQEILQPDGFQRLVIHYSTQQQPYVSGGVTFTYQPGIFTTPPDVDVSIEALPSLPVGTNLISPIIVSNTTTSTVVQVFVGTVAALAFTAYGEAATNAVNVHLFAAGS